MSVNNSGQEINILVTLILETKLKCNLKGNCPYIRKDGVPEQTCSSLHGSLRTKGGSYWIRFGLEWTLVGLDANRIQIVVMRTLLFVYTQ